MLMHHKIYWCILRTGTVAMYYPADLAKSLFFSQLLKDVWCFFARLRKFCMVTENSCIPETFPRCIISILYVHISLLPVTVMLIVFSFLLSFPSCCP